MGSRNNSRNKNKKKKFDITKISNFDLVTRVGILAQLIEQNADDSRIEEPKRQLKIIMEEVDRRNLTPDENGQFNITLNGLTEKEKAFIEDTSINIETINKENEEKNNNNNNENLDQTIGLDTLQLTARKD